MTQGIMKVAALYLANLKVALHSIIILLAAMLALVALVLFSLPQGLFSANDIPQISIAIVYGDGTHDDRFLRDLNSGLKTINVVEDVRISTLEEAEALLESGEISAIIIIPDDTLDVLVYGGHTTITVRANNALIGSAIYSMCDRAIEALDEMQNYALVYMQESSGHFDSQEEQYDAIDHFNMVLLTEALMRMNNIDTPWPVPLYYVQVLTLLMFLVVSIASFFVAVIAARQYATGYVRHLYTRGVRYWHLLISQLLVAASVSLVLGSILAVILNLIYSGLNVFSLVFSSVLLSLVLTVLYLLFSGFKQQPQAATTRTLIGCLALMFFLLFAGGGFYPTAFMQSDLRLFNPTWLSNQLAVWSLGGSLDAVHLMLFVVPFALACLVGYLEWRRSL